MLLWDSMQKTIYNEEITNVPKGVPKRTAPLAKVLKIITIWHLTNKLFMI